ncbi:hypothetical protein BY996DRAFT_1878238 [Phakopsora pachyrhizi]|uniref:Uncharacterized protein n=1 Tax=Phakopsora pachyrhizi TaxID=170000 RepID=A0AAV0BP77_PHAPC|nr:hypothetical protein BY996DRAFT_1878238 [Phakopsora pachyrhizi]CAH7689093.1 hypothetical protein PPACK8108_LOCUS24160 [Phakopsora pachyrhizi]
MDVSKSEPLDFISYNNKQLKHFIINLCSRWGQASLLLTDNSLLIYGGKVPGSGGFTYNSAPNTNEILLLSLDSTFQRSSPPWRNLSNSAQKTQDVSFATLGALVEPTDDAPGSILAFGGDLLSSSNTTGSDSSWEISLPPLKSASSESQGMITLNQLDSSWAGQPIRRIRHTSNTADDSGSVRLWVLGGQKDDGSQKAINELWQYSTSKSSPLQGSWSTCPYAPIPVFDHSTVAVVDANDAIRLYAIGGLGDDHQAVEMTNIYRFTPELTSEGCRGTWDTVQTHGSSSPPPRRGHAMVSLSSTQLLLYGGASASGQSVYDDIWLLDLNQLTWKQVTPMGSPQPGPRWGHSMIRVGNIIIIAFGFKSIENSQPASSDLGIFDLDSLRWISEFSPSQMSAKKHTEAQIGGGASPINSTQPNNKVNSWHVPGSQAPMKPVLTSSGDSGSSPVIKILGITLGVLGAAALALVAVICYRKKQNHNHNRKLEAAAYRRKANGPDFSEEDYDDDQLRLVNQKTSNYASTSGSPPIPEHPIPKVFKAISGIADSVVAHLSRKNEDVVRERFDMLADEESDIWVTVEGRKFRSDADGDCFDRAQALKKYADGWSDRLRLPPQPPLTMSEIHKGPPLVTTRGGLRIWQGLDDPTASNGGFGTSTSFLGASLAPWSDDGRGSSISEYGRLDSYSDPFSNDHAIAASNETSSFMISRTSLDSLARIDRADDETVSDIPISPASSDQYHATDSNESHLTIGFINAEHLPSSGHVELDGLTPTSPMIISNNLQPITKILERRATWWDRLRYGSEKHPAPESTPSAFNPIRDPAPAPSILPLSEFQQQSSVTPQNLIPPIIKLDNKIDEHGRCHKNFTSLSKETGIDHSSNTAAQVNISTQSTTRSGSTFTSSMIEAATAEMTVIQRMRTVDSNLMTDCSSSRPLSYDSQCNSLPGSLQKTLPSSSAHYEIESQLFSGPSTDHNRPLGPRGNHSSSNTTVEVNSFSEGKIISTPKPTAKRKQTAGVVGVRAMVQQFENTQEKTGIKLRTESGRKKVKVEHNLVKKPLLYVANPDG